MTDFDLTKPGPLLAGKRGLVMGVANDRSIAWGIARILAGQGAELAFTYQGGAFGRRALPLAQSLPMPQPMFVPHFAGHEPPQSTPVSVPFFS